MQPKSLALLFDPGEPETQIAAAQMASHLRMVARCLAVPADRHLPGRLEELEVDAVLNLVSRPDLALRVESACRLMEIPSAGPKIQALTLASDRLMFKDFLQLHNIPTPAAYVPRRPGQGIELDHRNFGFPVQVRRRMQPADVQEVYDMDALVAAVERIRALQDEAVVEHLAGGTSLCTALWDGQVVGTAEVRSFSDGMEELLIPAGLAETVVQTAQRMAARICSLLSARGALLVTGVYDEHAGELVLGVDAAPCLHRDGRFARIAAAYGFSQRDMAMALAQNVCNSLGARSVAFREPLSTSA